ncbi:MAG: hypothetical protein H6670_17360 [Anaerolineaceae bacterium]|nr:hypothetical protein [Anaerolineaceae bacterium]
MLDCYLTDRQKRMLASLVDGLKDGSIRTDWILRIGGGRIQGIRYFTRNQVSDATYDLWLGDEQPVSTDDFNVFVECGLMEHIGDYSNPRFRLNKGRIINFVSNGFSSEQRMLPIDGQTTNMALSSAYLIDMSQNEVLGPPKDNQSYANDVFVIMPFSDFPPIYDDHIKPIVESLGYSIKRGDDFFSKRSIMSDVWSAIVKSQLIIADCTNRNANVFYELGMAHTLNKSVIMLTQNMKDIPFDIRHLRVIEYKYTPPGMRVFENSLQNAIKSMMESID